MIRVLVVDDQVVVTEGLRVILSSEPTIEVVGVAYEGAQAVDLVGKLKPDIVLMDLKMPGMNGIKATQVIRQQYPDIYVLVLTTYAADEWLFDAIRAGASGYLLKDSDGDDIVAAIQGTVKGRTHIDPAIADRLLVLARQQVKPDTAVFAELSARELTILRYIARGFTNPDIAEELSLAEGTVRNNVSTILNKLGVADRTQAAALAWHHGFVQRGINDD
ncbi:MAG TPA: response regulator transcription factor [Aggregatilineaceae bacterium]|nr:response regulator transcription factor [Aggregatilineaceae bacterium]